MERVKKFFRIDGKYRFEINDLRALLQLINVSLIIFAGFQVGATFGLIIAVFGFVKDVITDRHINGMIIHYASIILNLYILTL